MMMDLLKAVLFVIAVFLVAPWLGQLGDIYFDYWEWVEDKVRWKK